MKASVEDPLFKPSSSDLSDPSELSEESDSDSLELILEKDLAKASEGNFINPDAWTPIATGSKGRRKAKQKVKEIAAATRKSPFSFPHFL